MPRMREANSSSFSTISEPCSNLLFYPSDLWNWTASCTQGFWNRNVLNERELSEGTVTNTNCWRALRQAFGGTAVGRGPGRVAKKRVTAQIIRGRMTTAAMQKERKSNTVLFTFCSGPSAILHMPACCSTVFWVTWSTDRSVWSVVKTQIFISNWLSLKIAFSTWFFLFWNASYT